MIAENHCGSDSRCPMMNVQASLCWMPIIYWRWETRSWCDLQMDKCRWYRSCLATIQDYIQAKLLLAKAWRINIVLVMVSHFTTSMRNKYAYSASQFHYRCYILYAIIMPWFLLGSLNVAREKLLECEITSNLESDDTLRSPKLKVHLLMRRVKSWMILLRKKGSSLLCHHHLFFLLILWVLTLHSLLLQAVGKWRF